MAGLLLLLTFLTACGDDEELPTPLVTRADPVAAATLLAELSTAVATAGEGDGIVVGEWPAYVVDNAAKVGVTDFVARFVDEDSAMTPGLSDGQWAAAVDLAWRFDERDPFAAHVEVTFVFDGRGDDLALVSVGGGGRVSPMWLSGPLVVAEDEDALVLLAGGDQDRADEFLSFASRAARVVTDALPKAEQGLVVEVPAGGADLERTLNVERGSYDNIAAVTTMVDGTTAPGSPVHVFVNDTLFSDLSDSGAQVVMTHEAVHVVTDAASQLNVPLWLVEGFADYVALQDSDLPLSVAAAQVIAQVKQDGLPKALPADADFEARTTHLGAAYEAAWLVCRVLAEHGDVAAMVDLQERIAGGTKPGRALQATHGLSTKELVAQWRSELQRLTR